eukprot:COSAG06_NODE_10454_length_1676_cov_1.380380_2_plen_119_part_00
MRGLRDISTNGVTFEGQVALLTGAGRGSIAIELGKALLQGGATVIVTTWERNDEFMQLLFKVRKLFFFCAFYTKSRIFYQDTLRTNIEMLRRNAVSAGPARRLRGVWLQGRPAHHGAG